MKTINNITILVIYNNLLEDLKTGKPTRTYKCDCTKSFTNAQISLFPSPFCYKKTWNCNAVCALDRGGRSHYVYLRLGVACYSQVVFYWAPESGFQNEKRKVIWRQRLKGRGEAKASHVDGVEDSDVGLREDNGPQGSSASKQIRVRIWE
jgi:hypothetical protein